MFAEAAIVLCGVTLLFSSIFAIIFAYLAYQRWLTHKELLIYAEKGLLPPAKNPQLSEQTGKLTNSNDIKNRNHGIFTAAIGLALCIGLYPLGWRSGFFLGVGPWMLFGLIPLFVGLTRILIWVLGKNDGNFQPARNAETTDMATEISDPPPPVSE
jgi:hypothetical protein